MIAYPLPSTMMAKDCWTNFVLIPVLHLISVSVLDITSHYTSSITTLFLAATLLNPWPLIVTTVPPAVVPNTGDNESTFGVSAFL